MKRARAIRLLFALLLSVAVWQWAGVSISAQTPAPPAADPNGSATGTANDVPLKEPGKPALIDALEAAGHSKIAINIVWTLITGFLVMFMQAGFAMVETGFCRAKNAAHTMSMNFMVYAIGMLGFWICGYALQMGGVGAVSALGGTPPLSHEFTVSLFGKTFGLFGLKGFFLSFGTYDVGVFALFLFQMVFMDTAATIPTGAMAERWKFFSFVLFGFFMSMFVYPLFANWVWGTGWLATLGSNFGIGHGHVDFAGSSVVHMTGGVIAFVFAWLCGPRIGKYYKDGSANALPAHNIPMAIIGTFILAFGWFGFNPGSTLAGTDLRIAVVATNTMLASATGALFATLWMWRVRGGKPDPSMMCNGMLAGLVAITAPCAFVSSVSACIIGMIAGVLVVEAALFIERKLRVDDPVGAIAVHGVNGAWGVLSIGIFADGTYGDGWNGVPGKVTGLLYGNSTQIVAEAIGVVANFVYIGLMSVIVYKLIDVIVGNRVSAAAEIEGLDLPEMGIPGYVGVAEDAEAEHARSGGMVGRAVAAEGR